MCDEGHGTDVHRAGKFYAGNLFASSFLLKIENRPPILGALSTLPVKKSGMGLHNPVTPAQEKYNRSLCASDWLIGAVKGKQMFSTADHIRAVKG